MKVRAAFRVNWRCRSAQIADGGYYRIQNSQILSTRYSESLSIQVHGKSNHFLFLPVAALAFMDFYSGGNEALSHWCFEVGCRFAGGSVTSGGQRAFWSGSAINRARGLIWKRTRSSSVTAVSLIG